MTFFGTFKKARTTDLQSFQDFYLATLTPLSRQLQNLGLKRREELEDVLQNSYLEAHKSFASLKDPKAGLAWMLTIGRRQFYLHLGQKLKQRKLFEEEGIALIDRMETYADARIRPSDERMHEGALCEIVLKEMEAIDDERRREAIRLYLLEDLSLKEVSETLGLNLSTLTTWISRFRQKLQFKLGEEESGRREDETLSLKVKEVCP